MVCSRSGLHSFDAGGWWKALPDSSGAWRPCAESRTGTSCFSRLKERLATLCPANTCRTVDAISQHSPMATRTTSRDPANIKTACGKPSPSSSCDGPERAVEAGAHASSSPAPQGSGQSAWMSWWSAAWICATQRLLRGSGAIGLLGLLAVRFWIALRSTSLWQFSPSMVVWQNSFLAWPWKKSHMSSRASMLRVLWPNHSGKEC
mmetsp:Transcript_39971/g.113022  ORF Transcript_39971/g.113022 Transcript_39971/m.113022 type:complete len:205 (-) Transcript_39971:259-873(-)